MSKSLPHLAPGTAFALSALAFTLSGCAVSRTSPPSVSANSLHLHGQVHGGQQPVSGATIQLYAAGSAGNASAATPMLTTSVLTDGNGSFDITGDYSCPANNVQVYLAATGGNPGLPGNGVNPAIAMVTALGDCGNLPSTQQVAINEVTTVAAAWALAPFASSLTNIGASSSNLAGLQNAMHTAMTLADSGTGVAPAASLPANATVETAKIYTLADVLAACVNSDGTTLCSSLFTDATPPSVATPGDTFQAALTIATNPGFNVAQLYNDVPPQVAFGGGLVSAPSDWTVSISYTGGGMNQPDAVAIDHTGNVWVAGLGGVVSSFSAQGSPTWTNGITGGGLNQSSSLAVDPAGNIWVGNMAAAGGGSGSVTQISPSGSVISGPAGFTAGINLPLQIAADQSGNTWVINSGQASVALLDPLGNPVSGANGYGVGVLTQPSAIALDNAGHPWITNQDTGMIVHMDAQGNMLAQAPCCQNPGLIALDSTGSLWITDIANGNSILDHLDGNGGVLTVGLSGGGLNQPTALSIDAGDNLWITNTMGNSLARFAGSHGSANVGTALSPANGFGADALMHAPAGVGVDFSGNVWVASSGDNRLINFVGLGTPTASPRLGTPQQP